MRQPALPEQPLCVRKGIYDMNDMIIGGALPNIPWEERPAGCDDVVWRSAKNPIITRSAIKNSNSVFNSAVVPYKGEFRGVFRSDDTCRLQKLYSGRSKDGVNWEIDREPINFI